MQEYDRNGYEDYDESEDEGQEQEYDSEGEEGDGYEEEQPPKMTQQELQYLEFRQKRKEYYRKRMKKESSTSHASSSERKLPYDDFGSFFGPSRPVIAERVLHETKSFIENQHHLTSSPNINKNKNKVSNGGSKSAVHYPPPKISEEKLKAQKLKNTRDYSFLLSDDAEIPAPAKEPQPRNLSARSSEARPAQVQGKSKPSLTSGGKHAYDGREDRKPGSLGGQLLHKGGSNNKVASTSKSSMTLADSRKQLGNNGVNGPGRPVGPKGLPQKVPAGTMGNKSAVPGTKGPVNPVQKQPISKVHSSISKQSVEQRKDPREKPRMLSRQPMSSSSIPQKSKRPTNVPPQCAIQDQRPKKKPVRRPFEDDEDEKAISMIRSMFRYNPNKFADDDEDDSNMEAGFDDILREERRSAKIGRKEDEEELRKIEEEEERERRKRMAKLKKSRLEH